LYFPGAARDSLNEMAERLSDEQWRNILELADAVVKYPKSQRLAFLEGAGSSPDVIQQVLVLTEAFEQPAEATDRVGTKIGHFLITEHLGRGGMGDVYAAHDVELERKVALKFLTPESLGLEGAGERFIREAKTASALNHPNIVTIYEVIRSESTVAIAMELVEGTPLRQLCGAPLPTRQQVHIARQIADALQAAHAAGVAHRDLKPENVMFRPDGHVKVLDFGLARRFAGGDGNPTGTSVSSVFAGTWRYMSPEQIKGEALTGASDVFSLGLIMYELGTGRHPFQATSPFETLQAIAGETAERPSKWSPQLPEYLDSLILAMLAKDPADRPSAESIARILTNYDSASNATTLQGEYLRPKGPGRFGYRWALALGASLIVIAGIWAGVRMRHSSPPAPTAFLVSPLTGSGSTELDPSLSPDGARVAFVSDASQGNFDIYVTDLNGGPPVRLTRDPATDLHPAWSRDGRWLAFLRVSEQGLDVMVIPATGGMERKIARISLRDFFNWKTDPLYTAGYPGPVWAADGESLIVTDSDGASTGDPLWQISLNSGQRKQLTHPELAHDFYPSLSHDGSRIAFSRQISDGICDVFVFDMKSGTEERATSDNQDVRGVTWGANDKTLVFASNRAGGHRLWMEQLNAKSPVALAVTGTKITNPSASEDGQVLVYTNTTFNVNLWSFVVTNPRAEPVRLAASASVNASPAVSPDGHSLAWASNRSGSWEIWIANADGSAPSQRTHLGRDVSGRLLGRPAGTPAWSPDGRRIAFDARANGNAAIMIMDAVGGEPRVLDQNSNNERMPSWSADGRYVYFGSDRIGNVRIWKRPVDGGNAIPVTTRTGDQAFESPDGKTVYFIPPSSESGIYQVPTAGAVETLVPGTGDYYVDRHWAISRDGIYFAGLGKSPREIVFYRFASGKIEPVRQLRKPLFADNPSLAFNPSTGSLIYAQQDEENSSIMVARATNP
jgi:Tol biopolymer transport system component